MTDRLRIASIVRWIRHHHIMDREQDIHVEGDPPRATRIPRQVHRAMPFLFVACASAPSIPPAPRPVGPMTARVEHGNSGGPVYDSEGRLVGITTAIAQGGGGYMTAVEKR